MGRSTFIIVFFSLLGLIAAVIPDDPHVDIMLRIEPKDSTELKTQEIFICRGHYYEWCTDSSSCAHCNETLERVNLWEYYKLLECEDCQKFFKENYENFIGEDQEL
jgi:hypothetical protein